jgi:hypothetical protein
MGGGAGGSEDQDFGLAGVGEKKVGGALKELGSGAATEERASGHTQLLRCWLLVAGCWLLVAGCWWLVAGGWLLVAGCWLLVAGCWLLVAGCWWWCRGYAGERMVRRPLAVAIIAGFLPVATVIAVVVGLALLFPGQMLRWLAQFNELGMAAFQALGPWAGVLLPLLAGGNGWRVISTRVRVAAKGCEGAVELLGKDYAG